MTMHTAYPIYCGGKFITTADVLEVINPFSGNVFATTSLAGPAELEAAIAAAQAVQHELKIMPSYKRAAILHQVAAALTAQRERLAAVLCAESGKPVRYAIAEIDRAAQTFTVAAEECKRIPREYLSLDWTPAGENREGLVKYFPVGLVAGIAPFNFPLNLAVHKIAPAIAAGCPIILKPASSTPLSTLELANILDETALPKGAVSILPMDRNSGNQLVTDERFKLLTFTGSPEVGWAMKKNAGKKKTVLELGGNAGVIVTSSCNLEKTVKKCLVGAFAYSGQICIHAQRFFVHERVFDAFVSAMKSGAEKLVIGDPADPATEMGVMIDETNAIRVESWVNAAVASGAQVLCGGKRSGSYYAPTMLTNTDATMQVCAEEIFGPVITIERYSTFEEAVHGINNTRFGLQAGVFSNDAAEINTAFEQLEVGGVIVNDVPTFRVDHMPYGGVKDSGQGREGVRYAMLDMLEPRLLVK